MEDDASRIDVCREPNAENLRSCRISIRQEDLDVVGSWSTSLACSALVPSSLGLPKS